jgi:hypothetical protein
MASMLNTYDEVVEDTADYGSSDEPADFDATNIPDDIVEQATTAETN